MYGKSVGELMQEAQEEFDELYEQHRFNEKESAATQEGFMRHDILKRPLANSIPVTRQGEAKPEPFPMGGFEHKKLNWCGCVVSSEGGGFFGGDGDDMHDKSMVYVGDYVEEIFVCKRRGMIRKSKYENNEPL